MDLPVLSRMSSNKERYSSLLSRNLSSSYENFEKDQEIFAQGMEVTGSARRMSFIENSKVNYEKDWKEAAHGSCEYGSNANSIMSSLSKKTYNRKLLNTQELTYFCKFIFLTNGIKHFCYADAQVFQTFHYMLHNKQMIPPNTIKDIMAMSNVNNLSQEELSALELVWSHKQTIGILSSKNRKKLFLPPLGLALDLIKNNQAPLHIESLKKMFDGCLNIKFVKLFKEINLKIVAYNQIPEMIELYDIISQKEGAANLGQLYEYLENSRLILGANNSDQLLDRFSPESKIRYIKASSQKKGLDEKSAKYLFSLLKSVENLRQEDFEIWFNENPFVVTFIAPKEKENIDEGFEKVLEDIIQLFSLENIPNASQFFHSIEKALNFESCIIEDTILSSYILSVLSELSYRKYIFPLSLTKKLNEVMITIPHHRIQKLICYILLCQKKNIASQQKIPESEFNPLVNYIKMNDLLAEARIMALKLLIEDKNNLELHESYEEILIDQVEKSSTIEMITLISKLFIKYKTANEMEGCYDELLTKLESSKFEKVSFPMLKVIIKENKILSKAGIEKLLSIIEVYPKIKVQVEGLEVLLYVFENENIEIECSIIKRVFDIFIDTKDLDVRVSAFHVLIKSTERKELLEVIDIIFEQIISFMVLSCKLIKEFNNERESCSEDSIGLANLETKKMEMCEKVCFFIYKTFENLSKHSSALISEKKQTLENQLLTVYHLVKKEKCLAKVENDIINTFNYALINEFNIPDEIIISISDEMLKKQEYAKYFKKTPIYNFYQGIQKEKKTTTKNQSTTGS